jgi:hypothetical protein
VTKVFLQRTRRFPNIERRKNILKASVDLARKEEKQQAV